MSKSKSTRENRVERARALRRNSTSPEQKLWGYLRDRRLAGLKFRRQHSIGPFYVDFYCAEHELAIEIDGRSHDGNAAYDLQRQRSLEQEGLVVLRINNEDVLFDIDSALKGILRACGRDCETGQILTAPHPNPLPFGETELSQPIERREL